MERGACPKCYRNAPSFSFYRKRDETNAAENAECQPLGGLPSGP